MHRHCLLQVLVVSCMRLVRRGSNRRYSTRMVMELQTPEVQTTAGLVTASRFLHSTSISGIQLCVDRLTLVTGSTMLRTTVVCRGCFSEMPMEEQSQNREGARASTLDWNSGSRTREIRTATYSTAVVRGSLGFGTTAA